MGSASIIIEGVNPMIWNDLTLESGIVNGATTAQYAVDASGMVHLKGRLKVTTALPVGDSIKIAQLPVQNLQKGSYIVPTDCGPRVITIDTSGDVYLEMGGPFSGIKNLVTANQSNVENDMDGIGAWLSQGQGTLIRDTANAWAGKASAKIHSTYVGTQSCALQVPSWDAKRLAVIPGQTYTFSLYAKTSVAGRNSHAAVWFFDAAGNGQEFVETPGIVTTTGWTRYTLTFTVPQDRYSLYGEIVAELLNGDNLWADGVQLEVGTNATDWQMSGNVMEFFLDGISFPMA